MRWFYEEKFLAALPKQLEIASTGGLGGYLAAKGHPILALVPLAGGWMLSTNKTDLSNLALSTLSTFTLTAAASLCKKRAKII